MWFFAVAAAFNVPVLPPSASAPVTHPHWLPLETRQSTVSLFDRGADVKVLVPRSAGPAPVESGGAGRAGALPCAVFAASFLAAFSLSGAARASTGQQLTRRGALQTVAGASLAATFGPRPAAAEEDVAAPEAPAAAAEAPAAPETPPPPPPPP